MTKSLSSLRSLMSIIRSIFVALTGAYALSIILYLLARFMIGEAHLNVIGFFNSFAHLLWMPALVLLPVTLLLRDWRLSAMLVPAVAAFVINYGALFLPQEAPVSAESDAITVMTYNIAAWNAEYDAVASVIREADADIVALQETTSGAISMLETQLAAQYPYQALHYDDSFLYAGQGILSRFPIIEDAYWKNALGNQRTRIGMDSGQEIVLYNLHLAVPRFNGWFAVEQRRAEMIDLLARTAQETTPLLIMGDFNMSDQSDEYSMIHSRYRDAFRDAGTGMGWTYPANIPFLRIDYLFYTPEWQVMNAQVIEDEGKSDHHPILFTLLPAGG